MREKDELRHYGILGMRWGHRKVEGDTGSRTNPSRRIADRVQAYKNRKAAQAKKDEEDLAKVKESSAKVIKDFDERAAKKAADKAFKKLKNDDSLDREAHLRRERAKADIDFLVGVSRHDKNFNEKELRAKLEKQYTKDLNADRESVRKERKDNARRLVAAAVIGVAGITASVLMKRYADKQYAESVRKMLNLESLKEARKVIHL